MPKFNAFNILNVNFHSYQLNHCNYFFNCLSNITKLFCCRFNTNEGKLFLFILPPNWLADEFVPSHCLPPNCLASIEKGDGMPSKHPP